MRITNPVGNQVSFFVKKNPWWMPDTKSNVVMIMMKYGIACALMACLLVGIGSGNFVFEPLEVFTPGWEGFGPGYVSNVSNVFGDYEYFNLDDWIDPPVPQTDESEPTWEPVPLIMPEPLAISKEDLFSSYATISTSKLSILSSYKSTSSFF